MGINTLVKFISWTGLILFIIGLSSCSKQEPIPFEGSYLGESRVEQWGFEELLDNNGNLVGVEVIRDTSFSQQDRFVVSTDKKNTLFTILGEGSLLRINGFSDHEFTYDGKDTYSIIDDSDGVISKRLEFTFDGTGKVTISYTENNDNGNRPPTGREISYTGLIE